MNTPRKFDLIVIGSGSGLEVSSEIAEQGWNVAVVDDGPFGGTCLNRGCIPSKMLVHGADVAETIRRAGEFGIYARLQAMDWQAVVKRVFGPIDEDSHNILEGNKQHPNISVFEGAARFSGNKLLEVTPNSGGTPVSISAETIVLAAGTRPQVPEMPGLDRVPYLTSDNVMRLPELPRRLVIVGGGYIAAEMAHVFGALGTEVTIVYRGKQLLRREDEDISRVFTEAYRKKFNLLLEARVTGVSRAGAGSVRAEIETAKGSDSLACDALLFATGRLPNTDRLDVAETGVKTSPSGHVAVDKYLRTSVDGIWALGDIVGRYELKHNANLEASHVLNNILNPGHMAAVDYHAMPHAIFASPQVGAVGITEQEARAQGIHYVASLQRYQDTAYGQSIRDDDGFVKVLADPHSGEVLGCHILGHDASVLIQEAINVMRARRKVDDIRDSIYIHPALPEVVSRAFGSLGM